MSDAEIRELEKLARSGDVSARAKWLVARERVGTLSREQLEIAAYAGDEAARRLVLMDRKLCDCGRRRKAHDRECPLRGRAIAETKDAFRVPRSTPLWVRALPANREAVVTAVFAALQS